MTCYNFGKSPNNFVENTLNALIADGHKADQLTHPEFKQAVREAEWRAKQDAKKAEWAEVDAAKAKREALRPKVEAVFAKQRRHAKLTTEDHRLLNEWRKAGAAVDKAYREKRQKNEGNRTPANTIGAMVNGDAIIKAATARRC